MNLLSLPLFMGFRLTTESGVPVSTSDRTSQGTLYLEPYSTVGAAGIASVYTGLGNQWQHRESAATSLALSGSSGDVKDILLGFSGLGFSLSQTAAWTNDTTRADAVTTQNGRLVLSSDKTKLVIGTVKYTGSNVVEDSAAKRFMWNSYNRVLRPLYHFETTDSWTYSTATYRQANASTSNQVEIVLGVNDQTINLILTVLARHTTAPEYLITALGEDSTTNPHASSQITLYVQEVTASSAIGLNKAELKAYPASIGYHKYCWLEYVSAATGTYFSATGGSPELRRSGIMGIFLM